MDNPTSLGDRINLIIGEVGGRKELIEKSGISASQLSRYTRNESQPTVDPLVAIAQAAGVNITWIATGQGPMKTSDPAPPANTVAIDFYPDIQPAAGAGNGVVSERSVPVSFDASYLRDEVRVEPRACALFKARGDSMSPTINSGDLLIVDQSVRRGDDIFVLRLNEDIMVKRLQFLPTGDVKVISDCDAYENYTLGREQQLDLHVIGRVAWHGGRC